MKSYKCNHNKWKIKFCFRNKSGALRNPTIDRLLYKLELNRYFNNKHNTDIICGVLHWLFDNLSRGCKMFGPIKSQSYWLLFWAFIGFNKKNMFLVAFRINLVNLISELKKAITHQKIYMKWLMILFIVYCYYELEIFHVFGSINDNQNLMLKTRNNLIP